jgi:hypothetical protein
MSVSCILQLEIAAQDLAPHTVYLAIASSLPPLPPDRRRSDGRAGDCRTQRFLGTARRDRSAAGAGRPLKSLVATEDWRHPNGHNQLPKIPQYKVHRPSCQIANSDR